jgi:Mannosyl-glycoprotein endo-beta-N-acetylglucosaminidase
MRALAGATFAAIATLLIPALSSPAAAADLPGIKATSSNAVPACATPGRLMAFLQSRNPKLSDRYDGIATDYMRHGEDLGVRWDYAFFQMMLETGNLTYTGDVKPGQNNFAGLGATGGGARGESFPDVSTGVRAHLQHVLMYGGEKIENPVAVRTRNIQEWGVLDDWQKTIKTPITYTHLAKKWAPTSRNYTRDISGIADAFYDGACKDADPRPELLADARKGHKSSVEVAKVEKTDVVPAGKGAEIAKKAIAEARASNDIPTRTGLGAGELVKAAAVTSPAAPAGPAPSFKILNASPDAAVESAASGLPPESDTAKVDVASFTGVANATADKSKAATAKSANCRVWTASYGGAKAIIIKAAASGATNYTVLDVNEGTEKKEAEAYISAYAKGGELVGEFGSSTQALDKAFELCPEG